MVLSLGVTMLLRSQINPAMSGSRVSGTTGMLLPQDLLGSSGNPKERLGPREKN